MKKAFLLLSITLLIAGCKNKETKTVDQPQGIVSSRAANECSFFSPLDSLGTQEQVKWLRENQEQAVLPQYDKCREDAHQITLAAYEKAVEAYWGSEVAVTTDISIGDVENLSQQILYVQFIAATINANKIIELSAADDFSDKPTCYSVPLFYSIQRLHSLPSSALLTFTAGKVGGKDVILFSIKGSTNYYDMSNNPI